KNIFANLEVNGIENGNAESEVADNILLRNKLGLFTQNLNTLTIHNNLFFDNETALHFENTHFKVQLNQNTLRNSTSKAILALNDSYPNLTNNNFLNNTMNIVTRGTRNHLGDFLQANDIEAVNNWWGTLNESEIKAKNRDGTQENVESWLGKVLITPFLRSEVAEAYPRN
ncbi:MAG: NosD domain-containing protein, partial [Thermodesulfobacteriota bacterium]